MQFVRVLSVFAILFAVTAQAHAGDAVDFCSRFVAVGSTVREPGVDLLPPNPTACGYSLGAISTRRWFETPPRTLASEPRGLGAGWYAWSVGGQLADAITTTRFRARGQEEGNARLRGVVDREAPFYALKVGVGAGSVALASWGSRHLDRRGRHGWARVVRLAPLAVGAWGVAAAVHNELNR